VIDDTPTAIGDIRSSTDLLLGYQDIAKRLRLSERTVRRLVNTGRFPLPFYIGRTPRWTESVVDDYIEQAQSKAQADTEKLRNRRTC